MAGGIKVAQAHDDSPLPSIDRFSGKYAFLSNFYQCLIYLDGASYSSVEHAFQAAKTLDSAERELIRHAPTAAMAKRLGRRARLRPDWDEVKLDVMEGLLRQKFDPDRNHYRLLQETAGRELIEGNNWRDFYWGVCSGVGENWLGKLLMKVRDGDSDNDGARGAE